MNLTVQEIKELMEAFHQNDLAGLEIKQGDFTLELRGRKTAYMPVQEQALQSGAYPAPAASSAADRESAPEPAGNVVASPIVGTFYEAAGPDKEPFVQVGARVRKGDVLFIIESMKLMNEVISEFDGTVTEIFVKNEEGVEFGQPILAIQPA